MKITAVLVLILFSLSSWSREKKIILHANGKVQYEYEMDGFLLDGKFSCYYESGKLMIKGQFSNNIKTGLWRVWDEKGLLRFERNYLDDGQFVIIAVWDSSGVKIQNSPLSNDKGNCDYKDYLFSNRFISTIDKKDSANTELFSSGGVIQSLLQNAEAGTVNGFKDDRLVQPLAPASFSCYGSNDVVSLLVKEDYFCCALHQSMNNKLLAVCPVIMEGGRKAELGWFYVPEISFNKEQWAKLKQHQYNSTIIKTTVADPSFKLRTVSSTENDSLRLMLVQFEASAILYTIDNHFLANN